MVCECIQGWTSTADIGRAGWLELVVWIIPWDCSEIDNLRYRNVQILEWTGEFSKNTTHLTEY